MHKLMMRLIFIFNHSDVWAASLGVAPLLKRSEFVVKRTLPALFVLLTLLLLGTLVPKNLIMQKFTYLLKIAR